LTIRCVDEQLREADDRVERSAQLVAHIGEEHALVLTRLLELPVCVLELGDQALALEPGGHRAHELLHPVELVASERRSEGTGHDHKPAVAFWVEDRQRDQRASATVETVAADAFRQLVEPLPKLLDAWLVEANSHPLLASTVERDGRRTAADAHCPLQRAPVEGVGVLVDQKEVFHVMAQALFLAGAPFTA